MNALTPGFKPLLDKIEKEGQCLDGGILKVDSFINHQIDPVLLEEMSSEFVRRFKDLKITKVMTIEASGIAPAAMVGLLLKVPVVFAKKKKPSTMADMYTTEVFSFTKNTTYTICCAREFLKKDDSIDII